MGLQCHVGKGVKNAWWQETKLSFSKMCYTLSFQKERNMYISSLYLLFFCSFSYILQYFQYEIFDGARDLICPLLSFFVDFILFVAN